MKKKKDIFINELSLNIMGGDLEGNKKQLDTINSLILEEKQVVVDAIEKNIIGRIQCNLDTVVGLKEKAGDLYINGLSHIFSIFSQEIRGNIEKSANEGRIILENIKYISDIKGDAMAEPLKNVKKFFEISSVDYNNDYKFMAEFSKALKVSPKSVKYNPFKHK